MRPNWVKMPAKSTTEQHSTIFRSRSWWIAIPPASTDLFVAGMQNSSPSWTQPGRPPRRDAGAPPWPDAAPQWHCAGGSPPGMRCCPAVTTDLLASQSSLLFKCEGACDVVERCGHLCVQEVSRSPVVMSMTAAVPPWTPQAIDLEPPLRSTIVASTSGMMVAANITHPTR